jgi:hypothetical protein
MPYFPELRKHLEKARAIAGKDEVFVVDRQHTRHSHASLFARNGGRLRESSLRAK